MPPQFQPMSEAIDSPESRGFLALASRKIRSFGGVALVASALPLLIAYEDTGRLPTEAGCLDEFDTGSTGPWSEFGKSLCKKDCCNDNLKNPLFAFDEKFSCLIGLSKVPFIPSEIESLNAKAALLYTYS